LGCYASIWFRPESVRGFDHFSVLLCKYRWHLWNVNQVVGVKKSLDSISVIPSLGRSAITVFSAGIYVNTVIGAIPASLVLGVLLRMDWTMCSTLGHLFKPSWNREVSLRNAFKTAQQMTSVVPFAEGSLLVTERWWHWRTSA
jgi:hypothetical protein